MWFEKKQQQEYHLVGQDEEKSNPIDSSTSSTSSSSHTISSILYLSTLLISLSLNIILLLRHTPPTCPPDLGKSTYTGNTFDTPVSFHSHNPYWDPNATLSSMNAAWDELNTNPMAIALSDSYVREKGLGRSSRFPWDTEKSVYYVKGIHDLHCLKLLRHAIVTKHYGNSSEGDVDGEGSSKDEGAGISMHHMLHCLDNLRQDIQCYADATPMPAPSIGHIGDLQTRQCRPWDRLIEWAVDGERNACHAFDDYREATNTLELFAHCPAGSVYEGVVGAYFGVHGHRDEYEVKEKEGMGGGTFDEVF
ncbi:hypothetical protein BDV96DRAFT_614945 [Lophiotrema nucula]|uniref:Uncharacterized protein n=1 Tax=Lophiotrema nucula TaxID=690887 RepID=A0A6A5YYJ8_9PLEO|nr:hypothetical protein BDV96DRAFT_614945 [Lophiotrema nucula]